MPLTLTDPIVSDARGAAAVYADGGVIGANPSTAGGTWAFAYCDSVSEEGLCPALGGCRDLKRLVLELLSGSATTEMAYTEQKNIYSAFRPHRHGGSTPNPVKIAASLFVSMVCERSELLLAQVLYSAILE